MTAEFQMVDVGGKQETARRALARGRLRMGREAFQLLASGRLPKGDALKLGEIAGVLAAKRTPELIPLCHLIPLERVRVWFELDAGLPGVAAYCEASARAKTGVEMEALSGVSAALLAVYDVVKQVDAGLTLTDIKLLEKDGGKAGAWRHPDAAVRAAPSTSSGEAPIMKGLGGKARVITVSDRCSKGEAEDLSGPALADGLKALGFEVGKPLVVPDERPRIEAAIREAAAGSDVVALTGGTGLSPRDVTPEALETVCDRLIPGVGEALRASSAHPMAALSRSTAGQLGPAIVVALPGSRGGVADGLKVLAGLLPHALEVARGGRSHPK